MTPFEQRRRLRVGRADTASLAAEPPSEATLQERAQRQCGQLADKTRLLKVVSEENGAPIGTTACPTDPESREHAEIRTLGRQVRFCPSGGGEKPWTESRSRCRADVPQAHDAGTRWPNLYCPLCASAGDGAVPAAGGQSVTACLTPQATRPGARAPFLVLGKNNPKAFETAETSSV